MPVTPALFTNDAAEDAAIKYSIEQDNIVKCMEKEGVKLPNKFMANTNFQVYDEVMDTYLNTQRGVSSILLNYVLRKLEDPDPLAVYANDAEQAVAFAPLVGSAFDQDNRRVYAIIKSLIIEGPAWSFITNPVDRAKDGRAAWGLLRAHYGNETYMNREIEQAYNALEHLHYKKEFANFTFEDFITQLMKHYNTLERNEEFVTEETKVCNLLRKISDPTLDAAKQAIRINEAYKTDFSAASNFLTASIVPLAKGRDRTIASLTRNNRNRCGGGRSQPGRTQGGRGGHNPHPNTRGGFHGRGRGRAGYGRGGGNAGRDYDDGHSTNYISPNDWARMSREQRDQVLQWRGTLRRSDTISLLSAVPQANIPQQVTTAPPPTSNVSVITADAQTIGTQAGREFGRQAHNPGRG
jgi:hypothetical protein